jgi:hypothetical protein
LRWVNLNAADLVDAYQEPEIQPWHARSVTLAEAEQWIAAAGARWTG